MTTHNSSAILPCGDSCLSLVHPKGFDFALCAFSHRHFLTHPTHLTLLRQFYDTTALASSLPRREMSIAAALPCMAFPYPRKGQHGHLKPQTMASYAQNDVCSPYHHHTNCYFPPSTALCFVNSCVFRNLSPRPIFPCDQNTRISKNTLLKMLELPIVKLQIYQDASSVDREARLNTPRYPASKSGC